MPFLLSAAILTALVVLLLASLACVRGQAVELLHDQEITTEVPQNDQYSACGKRDHSETPSISFRGVLTLGGYVTLTCVYGQASLRSPDDALHYHWFKDGQPVAGQQSGTLTLHNLSCSDQADYTCRASHTLNGTLSCTSGKHTVIVMVPPEAFIEQGNGGTYTLVEGDNLKLTCRVSNDPEPPVKKGGFRWTLRKLTNGEYVTSASPHDHGKIDLGSPRDTESIRGVKVVANHLTFQAVTRLYSGRYTCHVTNDPDSFRGIPAATASVEVRVQYLDSFVAVSLTALKRVVAGDNVTLTCQADSVPTANMTWLHQGRILRTVESNEDVYSFTATGCQDSGEYQCRADNEAVNKSIINKTSLVVQCPPAKDGSSNPEQSRFLGEELTLSVFSSGFPPPVYSWSGPRLKTGQGSNKLTLPHLQRDQAGVYTVNVSNEHGWFSLSFNVTVQHRDDDGAVVRSYSGELTLWLKVGGGIMAALLCLAFICLMLLRKRGGRHQLDHSNSLSSNAQHYSELCNRDPHDSAGRRRSPEVADYTSGESTGQYWSIDSADLSWQPQAVQPQDSLSHAPPELHYDAPPAPRRHPAPTPGHGGAQPSSDVTNTDYITPCHDGGNDATRDVSPSKAASSSESCSSECTESNRESDNSESYCVCHVVSGDNLASDSAAQEEDRSPRQDSTEDAIKSVD